MMEFLAMAAIAALVKKGLDLLRYLRAGDMNGFLTLLASMVLGVLAVVLAAHTSFAGDIAFGGEVLHDMNIWSQIFVGLTVAASAGLATDLIKAVDNAQSAAVPSLLSGEYPKENSRAYGIASTEPAPYELGEDDRYAMGDREDDNPEAHVGEEVDDGLAPRA